MRKIVVSATVLCATTLLVMFGSYLLDHGHDNDAIALAQCDDVMDVQITRESNSEGISKADPEMKDAASHDDTQYDVYYRCLNTLEYLDQLSGTIVIYKPARSNGMTSGTFEHDFRKDRYHSTITHQFHEDLTCPQTKSEIYNDAGHCITLYDNMDVGQDGYTETFHGPTLDGIVWSDKANIYATYGKDPTGAHELGVCYIPQEMTIGYLKNFDDWEIVDVIDWNGRECYLIQGIAEKEYGTRFDVDTFKIWVDKATGIWYRYEGYNASGDLTDYFYTDDLRFGPDARPVKEFSKEMVDGYKFLDVYGDLPNEDPSQ